MATQAEIVALLKIISKAYPAFEVDRDRTALFVDMLSDIPLDALKASCRQHIATNKFPPTIAELREGARIVSQPALPSWSDAWAEVLEQIRAVGSWGTPRWSHPLIEQAVAGMGGWQLMCSMEIGETGMWRAQFRDIYGAYASRADSAAKLLPSSREVATRYGALPPPRQEDAPRLSAPTEPQQPIDAAAPLRFAEAVRRFREESREEREAENRRKAQDWLKENAQ